MRTKKPLVSGYFEAWQYGPVHPATYRAFKASQSTPIKTRAKLTDPLTGKSKDIEKITDIDVVDLIRSVIQSLGNFSAGHLVKLSHAKNSPWDHIVDKSRTKVAFGLRIPDNVIKDRFQFHKVSVDVEHKDGAPFDDTPFT